MPTTTAALDALFSRIRDARRSTAKVVGVSGLALGALVGALPLLDMGHPVGAPVAGAGLGTLLVAGAAFLASRDPAREPAWRALRDDPASITRVVLAVRMMQSGAHTASVFDFTLRDGRVLRVNVPAALEPDVLATLGAVVPHAVATR